MNDVVIVGSGPAGLSAAIYAKRAGLSVLVAEKVYGGTGQMAESSRVDNYPGMPEINGFELGEKFRAHAQMLAVPFRTGEVRAISQKDGRWTVRFEDGETVEGRTVIYAAGASHRKLGVPGETEFTGKGVSYCASCDGAFFRGKDVLVVGGGNTAVDDALYLADLCRTVYVVHRRERFRADSASVQRLCAGENVEAVMEDEIREIVGDTVVNGVRLKSGRTIGVAGVFIAVGMEPATAGIREIVALDADGYIVADETGKTGTPGFFAAGDVRAKALRQIVTAVADGANAATSAKRYIDFA